MTNIENSNFCYDITVISNGQSDNGIRHDIVR